MYMINKVISQRRILNAIAREEAQSVGTSSKRESKDTNAQKDTECFPELDHLRDRLPWAEKRALRVTWGRLKPSRPGSKRQMMAMIGEILDKSISKHNSGHIFTQSAFIKAITERKSTVATLIDHAYFITDMIEELVFYVNSDPYRKEYIEQIVTIGRCHAHLAAYGFTPDLWETLGEMFAGTFSRQESVRMYPNAQRAWNIVAASLTDIFRSGYDARVKQIEATRALERKVSRGSCRKSVLSTRRPHSLDSRLLSGEKEPLPLKKYRQVVSFDVPVDSKDEREREWERSPRRLLPTTPGSCPARRRRLARQPRVDSVDF